MLLRRLRAPLLLLLAGCAPPVLAAPPSPPPAPPQVAAPRPATPPLAAALPDAAPPAPANLLDLASARIAVSSTVVNPHDFPEHLVDGKPGTAWNSRTGDLHGWIAFRVPPAAHVDRIELTCGYDRVDGRTDLFTANHRITRVAVTLDGEPVKEATLDPAVRGLQAIPIDGPGGDYRITVLATSPGTTREWRELVVSELRVVGSSSAATRGPDDPVRVSVGDLDAEPEGMPAEPWPLPATPGTHRSVAAACAAFVAEAKKRRADEVEHDVRYGEVKIGAPWCREIKSPVAFAGAGPYRSLHAVRSSDGIGSESRLVVEGAAGFALTSLGWDYDDPLDPGCPGTVRTSGLLEARVDNGYLVLVAEGYRLVYRETSTEGDTGMRGELVRLAFWARDEGSGLVFRRLDPQFQPTLGERTQPRARFVPWPTIPWVHVRPFHIAPDGTLRLQG